MAQVVVTRVPSSNGKYTVTQGGQKLGIIRLSTYPGSAMKWEVRSAGVSTFYRTKVEAVDSFKK